MVSLVHQFVSCCRSAGLRVSTAEVLDCLTQLRLIEITNEIEFRAALRANFAKSIREVNHFDRLYHLFFHEMRTDATDVMQSATLAGQIRDVTEMLKNQPHENSMFDAVADFIGGNPRAFLEEMRRIQTSSEPEVQIVRFNLGSLSDRLNIMMQIASVRTAIAAILQDPSMDLDGITRSEMVMHFDNRLETARSILMYEPRPGDKNTKKVKAYEQRLKELGERPFSSFTKIELAEMREAIDKLVRKLKNSVSRRFAAKQRGNLDVKKTIRSAARYGGVPVEIKYRNKPLRRSRIVTLCDVSGSVWAAARFMLNMLYSLQECFDKVNSFVFIDELIDVTSVFEEHNINEAIRHVLEEADVHYNAPTDYGVTLRHFRRDYMDILTKKTTLIIVGDGRSNYLYPEDAILGEMRDRCRRVIWLNPEPEHLWGTGDSEIKTYLHHCHEVRQCSNINQLVAFIEELVL